MVQQFKGLDGRYRLKNRNRKGSRFEGDPGGEYSLVVRSFLSYKLMFTYRFKVSFS